MSVKRPILLPILVLAFAGALVSCGDSAEGRPEGFRGVCRSCIEDEPQGPNESVEACEAFAARFGCENASLTGDCSNDVLANRATCEFTGCEMQPVCPVATN